MFDEDELTLRDKLAVAALPALIARFTSKVENKWYSDEKATEAFERNIKVISFMAYKIADEMRKARLQPFC